LPLACGMAADAYVVFARITGMTMGAAVAATLVLLVLLGFWYAWPLVDRLTRQPQSGEAQERQE
jgi:hypothetical protein